MSRKPKVESGKAKSANQTLDSANHFSVAPTIAGLGILLDEPPERRQLLTRDQALNLAAWLYATVEAQDALAEGLGNRTLADFNRLVLEINRT